MGGSVAMGADCERRSTTASEEASPKATSRIAERDMDIAEIEGVKKRDGSRIKKIISCYRGRGYNRACQ